MQTISINTFSTGEVNEPKKNDWVTAALTGRSHEEGIEQRCGG